MSELKLAVFCSHVDELAGANGEGLVELARLVEEAGADQIVLSEHVVLAASVEAHGPRGNPFPFRSDHTYPEPLIALAAMAGATTRVRLATGILIVPLRPAVVLAKMAATLDVVSGGRLDLGVGAGWHRAEFLAAGADPSRSTEALEDTIEACRALWAGGPATFDSGTVRFDDMYCHPVPIQGARLPVWFAGPATSATFRRIARLGDGWVPFGDTDSERIARGYELMKSIALEHGRDPDALGIRASLPIVGSRDCAGRLEGALEAASAYAEAGATVLQIPLHRLAQDLGDVPGVVSTAAREVHRLRSTAARSHPR